MSPKKFTVELPILWSDLDANGHVNNGKFQYLFDEGRIHMLRLIGLDVERLNGNSIGPVVIRSEIEYKKELKYPDKVRIVAWVSELKKSRAVIEEQIFRTSDNQLTCSGKFHAFFMDFKRRRPWIVPDANAVQLYDPN